MPILGALVGFGLFGYPLLIAAVALIVYRRQIIAWLRTQARIGFTAIAAMPVAQKRKAAVLMPIGGAVGIACVYGGALLGGEVAVRLFAGLGSPIAPPAPVMFFAPQVEWSVTNTMLLWFVLSALSWSLLAGSGWILRKL